MCRQRESRANPDEEKSTGAELDEEGIRARLSEAGGGTQGEGGNI